MNDPIAESNEAQSRFFAENPRDESITNKAGWQERWELMQAGLPENALCRDHDCNTDDDCTMQDDVRVPGGITILIAVFGLFVLYGAMLMAVLP